MEECCHQRKEKILATHEPEPISKELEHDLGQIVAAARRHLLKATSKKSLRLLGGTGIPACEEELTQKLRIFP